MMGNDEGQAAALIFTCQNNCQGCSLSGLAKDISGPPYIPDSCLCSVCRVIIIKKRPLFHRKALLLVGGDADFKMMPSSGSQSVG